MTVSSARTAMRWGAAMARFLHILAIWPLVRVVPGQRGCARDTGGAADAAGGRAADAAALGLDRRGGVVHHADRCGGLPRGAERADRPAARGVRLVARHDLGRRL